ncbi:hypothetical protein LOK49_LG06G02807 [Camellia lanceoleosa]|uniref:Uncharacterized protein n=1 Tax=Camellia lanceoleosa TaxID=1840588 RepID=A0ACC0HFQ2_9ERIC|nr:hypothetical protein LOK49_LG06G02807 [Camellia lanceoleosa]
MIGLVIGWSWRPRWTGLVYLGLRSKLRFAWTLPPGFGARRLWFAFTALSAFSVGRTLWSRFRGKGKESAAATAASGSDSPAIVSVDGSGGDIEPSTATSLIEDVVTEKGVEHLLNLLESKDGEMGWQNLMERSTSNMAYQAWRHEPETGPVVYLSRTVFEDATRAVPFFCSDREYIIGRRIWEDGTTYYYVTKGVPYPALQRSDKPRRVDLYFSSWVIKPVQSRRGDGQMTACEVTLVHYEDMGIPKDVAKLGVRHGMWGTVKKLHSGFRAYQQARKSEAPLSRSAVMAGKTTKIALEPTSSNEDEKGRAFTAGLTGDNGGFDWKWVAIGGAVAVVCGLQTGVIGKALLLGAGQRFARR